ncbi:MAG: hypothetical protein HY744_22350 [Deltaproteobacteria bacterium]|nr:hypothetical protein [Deltaproteobacteria bacterium]
MLDRVMLHQTRLRAPGLGLDAKGVAIGAKGLVLLPSVDRLVGWLALYTSGASLADLLGSLAIDLVRSPLGVHEVALTFAAESSERMDRLAELARLSGGYTFTGTGRHFVQYRDAAAPFGYDVREIAPTDAALVLSHSAFSQHYEYERRIDLRALLLRLEPSPDPAAGREPGSRWICAEAGPGEALVQYFVRSHVAAEVALVEWPPPSGFATAPVRRYLFQVGSPPERMRALLTGTPGIAAFVPAGPGSAIEVGYRHPIDLRACPVFAPEGLVLLRGGAQGVLCIDRLPALGPVGALARVRLRGDEIGAGAARPTAPPTIGLELRLAPDPRPWRDVKAIRVSPAQLGLLRQLAYRLARASIERTSIALTEQGAFLLDRSGIEGIPVGDYFRQIHERIFVAAGYGPVPAVSPEVLHRALGSPSAEVIFIDAKGRRIGVPDDAFVPLERTLLDAQSWTPLAAQSLPSVLATALPVVELDPPGWRPMRDVRAAEPEDAGPREPEGEA